MALRLHDEIGATRVLPSLGLVGTILTLPIVLWHLYTTEVHILLWIDGLFAGFGLLEMLYVTWEEVQGGQANFD